MLIENNAKISKSPPSLNAAVWGVEELKDNKIFSIFNNWGKDHILAFNLLQFGILTTKSRVILVL